MEMFQCPTKGRSIRTTRPYKENEFVVEYAGKLLSYKAGKQRDTELEDSPEIGCYLFFFRYADKSYCIDATEDTSDFGRLINHKMEKHLPNLQPYGRTIFDRVALCFRAKRDIKTGEELFYDYGERDRNRVAHHPWLTNCEV